MLERMLQECLEGAKKYLKIGWMSFISKNILTKNFSMLKIHLNGSKEEIYVWNFPQNENKKKMKIPYRAIIIFTTNDDDEKMITFSN